MPRQKSPKSLPKLKTLPRPSLLELWFKNSATVAVARITEVSGFITAVIGGLDWSPLLGASGFTQKQVITVGAIIILIGISHEVARRRTLDA